MNCDFLFSSDGSFTSAGDISSFGVKKVKDGYYGVIGYINDQGEILMSEGWSTLEAAQRCLGEFIKAMCNAMGNGDGLFKLGLPNDFCPREYAQSYVDDAGDIGKSAMEDVYEDSPIGKYNDLSELAQGQLDDIF